MISAELSYEDENLKNSHLDDGAHLGKIML